MYIDSQYTHLCAKLSLRTTEVMWNHQGIILPFIVHFSKTNFDFKKTKSSPKLWSSALFYLWKQLDSYENYRRLYILFQITWPYVRPSVWRLSVRLYVHYMTYNTFIIVQLFGRNRNWFRTFVVTSSWHKPWDIKNIEITVGRPIKFLSTNLCTSYKYCSIKWKAKIPFCCVLVESRQVDGIKFR